MRLWINMANLAEKIGDLMCGFDGTGVSDLTNETFAMVLFCWVVLGMFITWVCKFLYRRYVHSSSTAMEAAPEVAPSHSDVVSLYTFTDKVLAKEVDLKVLSAKEKARRDGSGRGNPGQKAVGHVPPMRKRVTKKSPGPEQVTSRKSLPDEAPHCSGAEPQVVRWVDEVLQWLYSDHVVVYELLATWVRALNDHQADSVEEHGVGVELIRVLPETSAPVISNVVAESNGHETSVTMDVEATPMFQLKAFRQRACRVDTAHYRVTVDRYKGRMCARLHRNTLKGELCPDGWPDVRLSLTAINPTGDETQLQLQDLATQIVTAALRGAGCPLDLSSYPTCPRYRDPGHNIPRHDSISTPWNRSTLVGNDTRDNRRLLVKVVRGEGLGGPHDAVQDPYCIVEMDEPAQRNQTVSRCGASPYWDEQFLFDLSPHTAEVLFEVYDKPDRNDNRVIKDPPGPRFLGLGLVSVHELAVGPHISQTLTLQTRPHEPNNKAFGSIAVEFVFIEGVGVPADRSPYKLKEAPHVSPNRSFKEQRTAGQNPIELRYEHLDLATSSSAVGDDIYKNTLVIQRVQRAGEYTTMTLPTQPVAGPGTPPTSKDTRGRNRKKGDFFETIKRRLGRSKYGSKSTDRATAEASGSGIEPRSLSVNPGTLGGKCRDSHGSGSKHSLLSDGSDTSGRTYVHEASTLVLETLENGVTKHFLVPLTVAQHPKWRCKGTKLHIYNDHTFVAKHISGGNLCPICSRSIPRRLGRQGYKCRDCALRCHKQCHVHALQLCPNATARGLELSLLPVLST